MGEARQIAGLSDAAGGHSAGRLVARPSLKAFIADESGATAVEYGLIIAGIFLAILSAVNLFASNAVNMFGTISTAVSGAMH